MKNPKILYAIMVVLVVAFIIFGLFLLNRRFTTIYEFDIALDNAFIRESSNIELYNSNNLVTKKTITETKKVDWSDSNNSSTSEIKKDQVIGYVKVDREYYLTSKGLVYTKKNNKFVLLKRKVNKLGVYESKPIIEVTENGKNVVYFIEIKNGKYVIDNVLEMEETREEVIKEDTTIVLPSEDLNHKNIKSKLQFDSDKVVSYENGDSLKDQESEEDIKVIYAIYVNGIEDRYYIVSEKMNLYVLTNQAEVIAPVAKVKSVLVNSSKIEISIQDSEDKLVFEIK